MIETQKRQSAAMALNQWPYVMPAQYASYVRAAQQQSPPMQQWPSSIYQQQPSPKRPDIVSLKSPVGQRISDSKSDMSICPDKIPSFNNSEATLDNNNEVDPFENLFKEKIDDDTQNVSNIQTFKLKQIVKENKSDNSNLSTINSEQYQNRPSMYGLSTFSGQPNFYPQQIPPFGTTNPQFYGQYYQQMQY